MWDTSGLKKCFVFCYVVLSCCSLSTVVCYRMQRYHLVLTTRMPSGWRE